MGVMRFIPLPVPRPAWFPPPPEPLVRYATRHRLHRVLAFTRRSIDDVINNPVARNEVFGYYKLLRQIERASEVRELEAQWNPVA